MLLGVHLFSSLTHSPFCFSSETQIALQPFTIVNIYLFIMRAYASAGLLILGFASLANAHTTFTTLYIDRKNQGDGTCVRMPYDGETATFPIHPVTSGDMACGKPSSLLVSSQPDADF